MKKFLPVLCIFMMVFAFGGAICDSDSDDDPKYPNCTAICEIIIEDCDLGSTSGPPGATVAECTQGCVEDEGGDMSSSDVTGMQNMSCSAIETMILSGDDGGGDINPADYPNCVSVCEIIITDCGLASDTGSPGSDVAECTEGCVDGEGGVDMSTSDAAGMASLSCVAIATMVK